jgi:hypothetical protein
VRQLRARLRHRVQHFIPVPSTSVNMDGVRCGGPDSWTTFTASATASDTEPSALSPPLGATESKKHGKSFLHLAIA